MEAGTIPYKEIYFSKTEIFIQNIKFEYYASPILCQYEFPHAYFTKSSSEKFLQLLGNHFNKNCINCFSNQIHSNVIVFGSHSPKGSKVDADGLVSDNCNQNLWVYTADCMPIFFADKRTRKVAALHCGRKGLEKKIIKNLVKIFDNLGTSRENLLVAIGPAISKKHYLVDTKTYKEFCRMAEIKALPINSSNNDLNTFKEKTLNQLDLKRYAHLQLLKESIPNKNIDISNLCTYELKNEFNSWRKSKTFSRQWNFICS
ncbi:MAG: peptidoglycan editing factor PgeF [Prochlorococcus marinus CUG1439]|uniref:peptidoglycan editing factor PgeF n=1 Tax=Prochlorococcus sp. MIT 1314 TaxID=3096220 RepID=UPI001B08429A|nr:peptidoglycan editing factor PgeF [Prochlorococcus sp. MIT 1314]MCR8539853.1 peptidoglycan editing factor PgeF [Prochlorococcus marinus CUG1439]